MGGPTHPSALWFAAIPSFSDSNCRKLSDMCTCWSELLISFPRQGAAAGMLTGASIVTIPAA